MPSVNITFYQFEKRSNSTRQPSGGGTTYACQIFDPCSVLTPRIKLSFPSGAGNPTLWNYAYIGDFTRFYFVRDWTWENGLWVARLVEDVLATWRENIRDSTQYVVRAASRWNSRVVDTVFPARASIQSVVRTQPNPWTDNINDGTFVLSVISAGTNGFGATSYYSMSTQAFNSLRNALLSDIDYLSISSEEISQELSKALFNPYQYIVSATWFPRSGLFQNAGFVTSEIGVGWWSLSINGSAFFIDSSANKFQLTQEFELPKHPQAGERGAWLNSPPYTTYILNIAPFGEIALDGSLLMDSSAVYAKIVVDAYTGYAFLYVSIDNPGNGMPTNVLAQRAAQVGVSVPLAQIAYSPPSSGSDLIGTSIAGALQGVLNVGESTPTDFTGNLVRDALSGVTSAIGGVVSGVANGIGNALENRYVTSQYKGSTGTVAGYSTQMYLIARHQYLVDDNQEDFGRPLCTRIQLSQLNGYVQCADPDIRLAASADEIDAVRKYLINGFFME